MSLTSASGGAEKVEILAGFPQRVQGRLVFMPQDNVNTDAIYGKDYTYRDDMTPEMMAKVVMENYDPQFAARDSRTHAARECNPRPQMPPQLLDLPGSTSRRAIPCAP